MKAWTRPPHGRHQKRREIFTKFNQKTFSIIFLETVPQPSHPKFTLRSPKDKTKKNSTPNQRQTLRGNTPNKGKAQQKKKILQEMGKKEQWNYVLRWKFYRETHSHTSKHRCCCLHELSFSRTMGSLCFLGGAFSLVEFYYFTIFSFSSNYE